MQPVEAKPSAETRPLVSPPHQAYCAYCEEEYAHKSKEQLEFYSFIKDSSSKVSNHPKPPPIEVGSPTNQSTYLYSGRKGYYPLNRHSIDKPYYHQSPDHFVTCPPCQRERERVKTLYQDGLSKSITE